MFINNIKLVNFRNYKEVELNPRKLNILIGDNAQGKSNFIESIFYIGNGFSYRTNQTRDLIKWDEDFFRIEANCENRNDNFSIKSILTQKEKKILIDEVKIKKLSTLYDYLAVCIFEPDDLMLIKGTPSNRRNFLDRHILIISPVYYELLKKFSNVNYQRNTILKNLKRERYLADNLEEWSNLYINLAYKILVRRIEFLKKLEPYLNYYLEKITKGNEKVHITYEINQLSEISLNQLPDFKQYQNKFNQLKKEEIERGNSLLGPQKDDFIVKINGYNVRQFGSQGQQRTVALCLKLSYLEIINDEIGEYPILLLDDVMSELDQDRRSVLTEAIHKKIQTFITTTDINLVKGLDKNSQILKVKSGNLSREVF